MTIIISQTMDTVSITPEEFMQAAYDFVDISDGIADGWKIVKHSDLHKTFIRKDTFIDRKEAESCLLKAEFVLFYNLSYGVPSFSFNVWNSSGVLCKLEDIRKMSFISINQKDFYSVITQQEHPVLHRPYFIVHPCHTAELLSTLKNNSKNIIVTFLSLITPLLKLRLPLEYGMTERQ